MFDHVYLHFSALETALMPYFLFIVYGVIALWVKGELAGRSYVKPESSSESTPEPTPPVSSAPLTERSRSEEGISNVEVVGDYLISVACPWVADLAEVPSLETEFEMAVIERTILPVSEAELAQLPAIPALVKTRKSKKRGLSEIIALEVRNELGDRASIGNN